MNDALKVIAGAPDRPLVIGDIEIPCYVLEGEQRLDLLNDPDVMAKVEFISRRMIDHELFIRQRREESELSLESVCPVPQ